jgi:hypothetical protein
LGAHASYIDRRAIRAILLEKGSTKLPSQKKRSTNRRVRSSGRRQAIVPTGSCIVLRAASSPADWGRQLALTEEQAEEARDVARDEVIAVAIDECANEYHAELEAAIVELERAKEGVLKAAQKLDWSPRLVQAFFRYDRADCDLDGFEYLRKMAEREDVAADSCDLN